MSLLIELVEIWGKKQLLEVGAVTSGGAYAANEASTTPVHHAPSSLLLLGHAVGMKLVVGLSPYAAPNHGADTCNYREPGGDER